MTHSGIQVVSFDAAGTLIHLAEDVGSSYTKVAADFGIFAESLPVREAFSRVWKRTHPPFSRASPVTDRDEKSWWCRFVREVFEDAGVALPGADVFSEFFEALYRHFEEPGTWLADPHAPEALDKISSSFRCVVLSNFDKRLRRILSDLNLLAPFESLFLSCEIGLSKPDPRLFELVSEQLEVPPDQILHVGDDPVCDWQGADSAGFRHFRVGTGRGTLSELLKELSLA